MDVSQEILKEKSTFYVFGSYYPEYYSGLKKFMLMKLILCYWRVNVIKYFWNVSKKWTFKKYCVFSLASCYIAFPIASILHSFNEYKV